MTTCLMVTLCVCPYSLECIFFSFHRKQFYKIALLKWGEHGETHCGSLLWVPFSVIRRGNSQLIRFVQIKFHAHLLVSLSSTFVSSASRLHFKGEKKDSWASKQRPTKHGTLEVKVWPQKCESSLWKASEEKSESFSLPSDFKYFLCQLKLDELSKALY